MMKYAILTAIALAALTACAATDEDAAAPEPYESLTAPTPDGVALKITTADKSYNVTVKAGTRIAVELEGVPTAGYMWKIAELPPFLEAVGEYGGPTTSAQLEPGFAGGRHWEGFTFNVVAAGEGVLRLEQTRAWESDEPPTDEFSVYLFAEE